MLGRLLRPVVTLLTAILAEESPAVLAASLTFGMIVGFVPKDNLLAAMLAALLLSLRLNLTVATASTAFCSGLATVLDPIADALGRAVLTHPSFVSAWAALYQLPLAPWTRFNNTVVMGSLLLALALATPLYLGCLHLVSRYRAPLLAWLDKAGLQQYLQAAAESPPTRSPA